MGSRTGRQVRRCKASTEIIVFSFQLRRVKREFRQFTSLVTDAHKLSAHIKFECKAEQASRSCLMASMEFGKV
jgi:hypothetical protein